jgi:PAS domain S-box-containing protein
MHKLDIDSESYYKQCFQAFNKMQIISKTDPDGVITGVNKNFCKISGYSEAELIGFIHNKIRHPDMKDAVFKKMWETITSGKIWRGEIKNYKKNMDFYWVRSVIFPIFDKNKNIIEYISFREDITRRKLLEQKLEKEDKLRREILHTLPDMVLLVHKTKGVVFMNNQCFIDLKFNSLADFLKEHECICELFVDKEGYLKKGTQKRHWTKDFEEFPDKTHSAIIKNRDGVEQVYNVRVSRFEDNKNLTVVHFLNITELQDCKKELVNTKKMIELLKTEIEKESYEEVKNIIMQYEG